MQTIVNPLYNPIADIVLANMPEHVTPVTTQYGDINITVRRCAKYVRSMGAYMITGGIEITATTTKRYMHRSSLNMKSQRRVPPNHSDTQLRNAILRCIAETHGISHVHEARELAYKAVETHIIPDADLEAACERFGNEGDYTTFDSDTCKKVIEWANGYPMRLSGM